MPNTGVLKELASRICLHDWDEAPSIQVKTSEYEYQIEQFQGTAFSSDYKCYRITGWEWVSSGPILHVKREKIDFVAKLTGRLEVLILNQLSKAGFQVPYVIYAIGNAKDPQKTILFETMLPGKELYRSDTEDSWIAATDTIAAIHAKYWNTSSQPSLYWCEIPADVRKIAVDRFYKTMASLHNHAQGHQAWMEVIPLIENRLKAAPKTLVHSDLFPTNILIYGRTAFLLDWATAGEMPYFMDLGRFTGLLATNTAKRLCRYEDSVCRRYYERMQGHLDMPYEGFMKDVYMGQFIEVIRYYEPIEDIFNRTPSKDHLATEKRLNDLCRLIQPAKNQ